MSYLQASWNNPDALVMDYYTCVRTHKVSDSQQEWERADYGGEWFVAIWMSVSVNLWQFAARRRKVCAQVDVLGHRSDRRSATVIKPINVVCRNVSNLIDTESSGRLERRTPLIAKELNDAHLLLLSNQKLGVESNLCLLYALLEDQEKGMERYEAVAFWIKISLVQWLKLSIDINNCLMAIQVLLAKGRFPKRMLVYETNFNTTEEEQMHSYETLSFLVILMSKSVGNIIFS